MVTVILMTILVLLKIDRKYMERRKGGREGERKEGKKEEKKEGKTVEKNYTNKVEGLSQ